MAVIDTVPDDSFRDRALGLLLGSMIADSSASYIGHQDKPPTSATLNRCLSMTGGGTFSLGVGQIRNCELQMCLLWGLVDRNMNFDKDRVLDLKTTMDFYKRWVLSEPPSQFGFAGALLRAL